MSSGVSFSVQIKIDNADKLAGCVLTLVYSENMLELETPSVTTDYFTTFTDTRASASPTEIALWQYNDTAAGKILLTGANPPGWSASEIATDISQNGMPTLRTGRLTVRPART